MRLATTYMVLLSLLLSSCRYNRYYPVDFNLNIDQITALDLEEDDHWYSSGEDEYWADRDVLKKPCPPFSL